MCLAISCSSRGTELHGTEELAAGGGLRWGRLHADLVGALVKPWLMGGRSDPTLGKVDVRLADVEADARSPEFDGCNRGGSGANEWIEH